MAGVGELGSYTFNGARHGYAGAYVLGEGTSSVSSGGGGGGSSSLLRAFPVNIELRLFPTTSDRGFPST